MIDDGFGGTSPRPPRRETLELPTGLRSLTGRFATDDATVSSGIRRFAKLGIFIIAFPLVLPTLVIMSFLAIFVALLFGLPLFSAGNFDVLAMKTKSGGRSGPRR
jgi:hypothetical protein